MTTRGRRLGVDVGEVRVGVAISDPDGVLASPLVTLQRSHEPDNRGVTGDMSELARLVETHDIVEVVVGLPTTLRGEEGAAAARARQYAQRLAELIAPVPVRLSDERLSTVLAIRKLAARGVRGRRQRKVVDQAAAVEILQGWLDSRRRRGTL